MKLTSNDLSVLRFAAEDPEGRVGFHLTEEGTIALTRRGVEAPLPAGDAFPGLEELGLLVREVSRSFVLSERGWELAREGSRTTGQE
jgi:hypothetical protein